MDVSRIELIRTKTYIRTKHPIWCYTISYKTKQVKERKGVITKLRKYSDRAMFRDETDSRDWTLNSLSPYEATVLGASIWFSEPNFDAAVKAFSIAGRQMSKEYSGQSERSSERSLAIERSYIHD